jgi:lysozyme
VNQAGLALLKHYEGFRGNAYLDIAGVPTIGYGFTMGVQLGDRMTLSEAEDRLQEELVNYERSIPPGNENQRAAMTCLAYNVGVGAFIGSTVARKHIAGQHQEAADAFRMWCKARVKGELVTVPGLVRRRESERSLYLTPVPTAVPESFWNRFRSLFQ